MPAPYILPGNTVITFVILHVGKWKQREVKTSLVPLLETQTQEPGTPPLHHTTSQESDDKR